MRTGVVAVLAAVVLLYTVDIEELNAPIVRELTEEHATVDPGASPERLAAWEEALAEAEAQASANDPVEMPDEEPEPAPAEPALAPAAPERKEVVAEVEPPPVAPVPRKEAKRQQAKKRANVDTEFAPGATMLSESHPPPPSPPPLSPPPPNPPPPLKWGELGFGYAVQVEGGGAASSPGGAGAPALSRGELGSLPLPELRRRFRAELGKEAPSDATKGGLLDELAPQFEEGEGELDMSTSGKFNLPKDFQNTVKEIQDPRRRKIRLRKEKEKERKEASSSRLQRWVALRAQAQAKGWKGSTSKSSKGSSSPSSSKSSSSSSKTSKSSGSSKKSG